MLTADVVAAMRTGATLVSEQGVRDRSWRLVLDLGSSALGPLGTDEIPVPRRSAQAAIAKLRSAGHLEASPGADPLEFRFSRGSNITLIPIASHP